MSEEYGEEYYKRCAAKGIDYAFYGSWQKQYAKLVVFMTGIYKMDYRDKSMLDIGCACGVNLKAFRETAIFDNYYGIDISQYLIELGKKKFELSENELRIGSSCELPFENNTIDFIHCSQLFEHLTHDEVLNTIQEMKRVLVKNGKGFITLDAIKKGRPKKKVLEQDSSHTIAKEKSWWKALFIKEFEIQDEIRTNSIFEKGKFYPGGSDDLDPTKKEENKRRTFYDHYNSEWTVFILKGR
jgi:ubiquinone/menaquinone biosynthesis C-methylase UbiE